MQRSGANAPHPPWGIGVDIPTPANADTQPVTHWNRLPGSFSPLTMYHLRCWQGVFPGIRDFFIDCQGRFRSADIAWFASGKNRDGNHIHRRTSFHPSLVALVRESPTKQVKVERKALLAELKELMFDIATMHDRLTGSTTMIVSSGGTTVPGAPTRPEFLKASVYLPPAFIAHHPDLHRPIMDMVQRFIETVGVRTVTMWTQRARNDLGYNLPQTANPPQNPPFTTIPNPDNNSAHYTFLGQPYPDPPSAHDLAPSPTFSSSCRSDEDPDDTAFIILDLQQHNDDLQNQISLLQEHIGELEEKAKDAELKICTLSLKWKRAEERVQLLDSQSQKVTQHSRTPMQPTLSRYGQATPSRATPARAQTPSSYTNPAPKTPETPSRHRIQSSSGTPAVSRTLHLGTPSVAYSAHASPSTSRTARHATALSNTDGLASTSVLLLPHYIHLYDLNHLAAPLNMISTYIPAANRTLELKKLGLDETVCNTLAEGMALDKGEYAPHRMNLGEE